MNSTPPGSISELPQLGRRKPGSKSKLLENSLRMWLISGLAVGLMVLGFAINPSVAYCQQPSGKIHLNALTDARLSPEMDFAPWSRLLTRYVDGRGNIEYSKWAANESDRRSLNELLANVASVDVTQLSPSQAKAFWINVYNASNVECRLRQQSNPSSVPTQLWQNVFVYVGGVEISIDAMEQEKLRPMKDYRTHFALHCGAKSCPQLRNTAWSDNALDSDLDSAARDFLGSEHGVHFDPESKTLRISKLFEWYQDDFGTDRNQILTSIRPFLSPRLREQIAAVPAGDLNIEYMDYDWSLSVSEPTGSSLPNEVEYWSGQKSVYAEGIVKSNHLLERLLMPINARPSATQESERTQGERTAQPDALIVDRIATVVASFQSQVSQRDDGMISVANFDVSASRLRSQLRGEMLMPTDLRPFDSFDGRWFGMWSTTAVNHDWRPSRIYSEPCRSGTAGPMVVIDQYAWIHNGFGWNYLVKGAKAAHPQVLGYVAYLNPDNLKKIEGVKPHVGFVDFPVVSGDSAAPVTRLVWITEQEIFLEEAFLNLNPKLSRYAITGIYHQLLSDKPTVSGKAVQAIYTRESKARPPFREIDWTPDFCW